jgi:hypothetical protein
MSLYNLVNIISVDNLTTKRLKYISLAANIAENSDFEASKRLGAFLEYKGSHYLCCNNHRTRVGRADCISLHAEINVILQALKKYEKNASLKSKLKLTGSTIYVVRLKNNDKKTDYRPYKFGISKPCSNCEKQLYKFNISKIFYTDCIDGKDVLCELRIN